jgi:poly-gamma-glutamate synthesis protein (capsule biosynthesis protein)
VAPDLGKPSGFPQFNFPERILPSLKEAGIDVVSTANNHALDKGAKGIRSTIKNLKKHKISHTGTISSAQALLQGKENWWSISKLGDKKIAWISCTEMTNGIKDKENLVLYCFKDIEKVKTAIKYLKAKKDISAIILLPHWGEEEEYEIEGYRKRWAHIMLNLGASAVVGSHPHVVQKIESFMTDDGRPTVIAYSLGNFISNQFWLWTKASMLLLLKFKEDLTSAQLIVDDVKYVPLWMNRTIEKDGTAKYRLLPVFDFKKVPHDASQIWIQQLGNEKRLKEPSDVEHFFKPLEVLGSSK